MESRTSRSGPSLGDPWQRVTVTGSALFESWGRSWRLFHWWCSVFWSACCCAAPAVCLALWEPATPAAELARAVMILEAAMGPMIGAAVVAISSGSMVRSLR